MPFTFAHPAAAIPLRGCLGRFGVLSALVIGSITPDLSYFLTWDVPRSESHSLFGLLRFCLPVGLLSYIVFHTLLKGPLLALLPSSVICRLGAHTARFQSLPPVSWAAVVVSLLCGAMTHLVWDAFTHDHAVVVTAFPVLQAHLFSIGTYHVQVYKMLQHGSTVLGLALLSLWAWQWLAQASLGNNAPLPVRLSATQRHVVLLAIVCTSVAAGIWAGVQGIGSRTGMLALQVFTRKAVFSGLPTLTLAVMLYSISWHCWRFQKSVG